MTVFPVLWGWRQRKWPGIAEDSMVPVIRRITRPGLSSDEHAGCCDVILHPSEPTSDIRCS